MLPNLIVAGVTKGGTTALFRYLAAHPDVCASAVKETCHFLPLRYGNPVPPLAGYERHFRHCTGQSLVIESTPGYYYGGPELAQEIARTLPDVRIVLVFRDPVRRFFSFFHFLKSMQQLPQDMPVETYLRDCLARPREVFRDNDEDPWFGVEGGFYADYLAPWVALFGDRLHVTFFEDLATDTRRFMQDLSAFAGIDPAPFETMDFPQENKSRGHRNALLHAVALRAYRATAPVLNRNPALKRMIAKAYNAANEAPMDRDAEAEARVAERLGAHYATANATLRQQLEALPEGIVTRPFPAWLAS